MLISTKTYLIIYTPSHGPFPPPLMKKVIIRSSRYFDNLQISFYQPLTAQLLNLNSLHVFNCKHNICFLKIEKGIRRKTIDQSNFIEITFRPGCSPVNLLHIFTILIPKNTSGPLRLNNHTKQYIVILQLTRVLLLVVSTVKAMFVFRM